MVRAHPGNAANEEQTPGRGIFFRFTGVSIVLQICNRRAAGRLMRRVVEAAALPLPCGAPFPGPGPRDTSQPAPALSLEEWCEFHELLVPHGVFPLL